MPKIESADWNGAALRLRSMLPTETDDHLALSICDIRAADPGCDSGPGCPHPEDEEAADEALAIAEVLVERKVDPSTAAFLGACLASALCGGEHWVDVSKRTDETLARWAARLLDTGTGGAPDTDEEPCTDDMLRSVAWWRERGDPDEAPPEDIATWTEMLLARAYGERWADACADALGRA